MEFITYFAQFGMSLATLILVILIYSKVNKK